MQPPFPSVLTCRFCGQAHRPVALAGGETARCVRCDAHIASASRWGGQHAPTAFALSGLAFAVPAALLPFITVEKFGNLRTGDFLASVFALEQHGMPLVAVWVLICGGLTPLLLLAGLALGRRSPASLRWIGDAFGDWAMPDVYVLAVFIALTRLGSIVDVELNAGFWSYTAMSFALLLAWRTHRLQSNVSPHA